MGIWTVTYTYIDGNGCTNTATTDITVNLPTGIAMEGVEESALDVIPNPTSGIFTINLKNNIAVTEICIYDLLGNCVWNKVSIKKNNQEIDLSSQPKGIYFIEIISDRKREMKKIVLQ